MDSDKAIALIDPFIKAVRDKDKYELYRDLVKGSLENVTYENIYNNSTYARGYTLRTLKQIIAPKLWENLTKVLQQNNILTQEGKVKKNNLWKIIDLIQCSSFNGVKPNVLPLICNRYQAISRLETEELTRTYLAIDEGMIDRPQCIVKQIDSDFVDSVQKLETQAKILRNLGKQCDRVPQLYGYMEEENNFNLIVEYITGTPLRKKLESNKSWSGKDVIDLLSEVLTILEFIHKRNIIHRNICPRNLIYREEDNRIVLINFDTIKSLIDDESSITTKYTLDCYAAPELTIYPSFNCDIYALGKIIIQALTGLHIKQIKVNKRTLNIIWRDLIKIDSSFADIIDKMTCYDFRQRYQSAQEVLEDLRNLPSSNF